MADIERVVLGIDTGFAHIGYSVGSIDVLKQKELLDYGYWDLHSKHKTMNKRSFQGMKLLYKKLVSSYNEFGFTSIVLETVPPMSFNGKDATLASTNMFRAFAIFNDLEYTEVHAMTAKKFATSSGKASKDEMKAAAIKDFDVEDSLRYDVYDAINIMHCGMCMSEADWNFV